VTTRVSVAHPGRVVELGFIPTFEPREFSMLFEDFPIWILALEKSFCSCLHILGWGSPLLLKGHLETLNVPVVLVHRAITHLGLGRVRYHADVTPPRGSLVLVSGSPAFLAQAAKPLQGWETLFLGSEH
jgi:hypothetical protein